YRANKERYLMDLAIESANEAAIKQKEIILPEMSSFDRRIIHSALKTRKNIETESIGIEPNRRIVIKAKK
ncbi:protein jag, partial [Candidatus Gribaldobacteria bacterium]|nr:protein jag [Candidatus Gribaldobacteria bacterium]